MDDPNVFPSVELPEIPEYDEDEFKYMPSVKFDFEKGDFVLDGQHRMVVADGREAYIEWCLKATDTERAVFLAYSDDYGVEFEELADVGQYDARESELQTQITDALMVNPMTEYVDDFQFTHTADTTYVSFRVKGYNYEEEVIEQSYPNR